MEQGLSGAIIDFRGYEIMLKWYTILDRKNKFRYTLQHGDHSW